MAVPEGLFRRRFLDNRADKRAVTVAYDILAAYFFVSNWAQRCLSFGLPYTFSFAKEKWQRPGYTTRAYPCMLLIRLKTFLFGRFWAA